MKDSQAQGRTARTALDGAAAWMARGASGIWLRAGSRLGLACRGTVYLLVGYLAFRLALASHGRAGAPASSAGAVQAAVDPVWGRVPLMLLVAGLAAYALTQLVEAVFRPAHAAGTMGRWRQRAVSSWGFVLYSVFCLSTARLLAETPPEQTAQSEQRQDAGIGGGDVHLAVVGTVPRAGRVGVVHVVVIRIFERLGWATGVHWPDPARLAAHRRNSSQDQPQPVLQSAER